MLVSPEASSCMWQAICSLVFTSDTVQHACDGEMAEGGNMLTAASHWLPSPWLACQSGPARGVLGKEWSHPCCGQPLFPPFSCPSKVGRAGQIAARFALLAAYYGAATLPAYPPASLIGATPGQTL